MSNINQNRIDIVLEDSAITTIKDCATKILGVLPSNASLSNDERERYTSIDVENKKFTEEALKIAQNTGEGIVRQSIKLPAMEKDLLLYNQAHEIEGILLNLVQRVNDIMRITGHESYNAARRIYDDYKQGAEDGLDNAKAGYDALKVRFEAQGGNKPDTTP